MKHILLDKAFNYKKRREINVPDGYSYNSLLGAWINPVDKSFLVQSSNYPKMGSKKEDIETGEDQKGE